MPLLLALFLRYYGVGPAGGAHMWISHALLDYHYGHRSNGVGARAYPDSTVLECIDVRCRHHLVRQVIPGFDHADFE